MFGQYCGYQLYDDDVKLCCVVVDSDNLDVM